MLGHTPAAVLFDCDGVLVDSETITNSLLRDDLAGRGLSLTLEETMSLFVGGTMEGVMAEAARYGADMPVDWIAQFYTKMFEALAHEVEPVPGVSQLLDRLLAADIATAVASNGPRAKMDITLERSGLMSRLSPHVYSARDLKRPKPAPDIYLHAARQLGVVSDGCVVVEDSVSGAQAARAADMHCIGFAAMGQRAKLAPHCDVVLEDMSAVARYLGV